MSARKKEGSGGPHTLKTSNSTSSAVPFTKTKRVSSKNAVDTSLAGSPGVPGAKQARSNESTPTHKSGMEFRSRNSSSPVQPVEVKSMVDVMAELESATQSGEAGHDRELLVQELASLEEIMEKKEEKRKKFMAELKRAEAEINSLNKEIEGRRRDLGKEGLHGEEGKGKAKTQRQKKKMRHKSNLEGLHDSQSSHQLVQKGRSNELRRQIILTLMQERASAASKQDMDKCNLSGPRMLSAFDYIIGRGRSGTVIDGIGPLIDPTIEKGGETAPPLTEASENGQRAKPSELSAIDYILGKNNRAFTTDERETSSSAPYTPSSRTSLPGERTPQEQFANPPGSVSGHQSSSALEFLLGPDKVKGIAGGAVPVGGAGVGGVGVGGAQITARRTIPVLTAPSGAGVDNERQAVTGFRTKTHNSFHSRPQRPVSTIVLGSGGKTLGKAGSLSVIRKPQAPPPFVPYLPPLPGATIQEKGDSVPQKTPPLSPLHLASPDAHDFCLGSPDVSGTVVGEKGEGMTGVKDSESGEDSEAVRKTMSDFRSQLMRNRTSDDLPLPKGTLVGKPLTSSAGDVDEVAADNYMGLQNTEDAVTSASSSASTSVISKIGSYESTGGTVNIAVDMSEEDLASDSCNSTKSTPLATPHRQPTETLDLMPLSPQEGVRPATKPSRKLSNKGRGGKGSGSAVAAEELPSAQNSYSCSVDISVAAKKIRPRRHSLGAYGGCEATGEERTKDDLIDAREKTTEKVLFSKRSESKRDMTSGTKRKKDKLKKCRKGGSSIVHAKKSPQSVFDENSSYMLPSQPLSPLHSHNKSERKPDVKKKNSDPLKKASRSKKSFSSHPRKRSQSKGKTTDASEMSSGTSEESSSDDDHEDEGDAQFELTPWTKRFQACVEILTSLTPSTPIEERMKANTELMHLSDDFVHAARTFGKIIISEVFVPVTKKTITPQTIGGIVGGEKYIVHNILFKFATDVLNVFGGNAAGSCKVADQELKGLMTFFSLGLKDLYFPMMALVDYRGYRLVAMTLLPVGKETLVYGSNNAGQTVVKSHKGFAKLMRHAGEQLNLRPHLCGCQPRYAKKLWTGADVEGHVGDDGKFYLLDFGRVMPPVTPDKRFTNGHIYQLFRREFLVRYPKRLCSDAYSGFVMLDPKRKSYEKDIDSATQLLFTSVIPSFAAHLLEHMRKFPNSGCSVVAELMHQHGINLRYIGKVLSTYDLSNMILSAKNPDECAQVTTLLITEATARVIKNQMNEMLRKKMEEIKQPVEVVYRALVVDFLNTVFSASSDKSSCSWWDNTLPDALALHFHILRYQILDSETLVSTWRQRVLHDKPPNIGVLRGALFDRLIELSGLHVTEEAKGKFHEPDLSERDWNHPLDLLDVVELGERVKHMDVVSRTKGIFFQLKASQEPDPTVAASLLERSIQSFKRALTCMPSNKDTLLHCAISWFRLLEIRARLTEGTVNHMGMEVSYFDRNEPIVQQAEQVFRRALGSDDTNISILCISGQFFSHCRKYEIAEECFLRALERDHTFPLALICYGNFLYQIGRGQEGEGFLTYALTLDSQNIGVFDNPAIGLETTKYPFKILTEEGAPIQISLSNTISTKGLLEKVLELLESQGLARIDDEEEAGEGVLLCLQFAKEKNAGFDKLINNVAHMLRKKEITIRIMDQTELPWLAVQDKKNLLMFLRSEERLYELTAGKG